MMRQELKTRDKTIKEKHIIYYQSKADSKMCTILKALNT